MIRIIGGGRISLEPIIEVPKSRHTEDGGSMDLRNDGILS